MKTIGLIGGMSWESTQEYYRTINEVTRRELGGLHSARLIMYSVDFADIESRQAQDRWDELSEMMIAAAITLENAGAELILICANTMHRMADEVQSAIGVPLLHIADATAGSIRKQGLQRVALLGTKFTMEQHFYRRRLEKTHKIEVVIPNDRARKIIHEVIYTELVVGKIIDSSKRKYLEIIQSLIDGGAQGIILGCTEIPLLIGQTDVSVPVFDTAVLHGEYAVRKALDGDL